MAEDERTERDKLIWATRVVQNWRPSRMPNGVESAFITLQDLDQGKNIDLWHAFREALAENDDLRHPELLKFIDRPELAARGYWWYDPGRWRAPIEV